MESLKEILIQLKKPIPYKWRVQSYSKNKPQASCVAYIDSRDVQDVLDNYCLWSDRYYSEDGKLFCEITIYADGREYKRSDTGSESQAEAQKGYSSDAFKRAAVKFGVGRFLYDLPIKYLLANEKKVDGKYPYAVNNKGEKIWDITEHINTINPETRIIKKTKKLTELKKDESESRNWNRAVASLRQGKTIEYLKTLFSISEVNQALLLKESKEVK